jgi:hypothetical protein
MTSCAVPAPKCWLQYMAAARWAAGKPSGGVYVTMTRRDGPAAGSTMGAGAGAGAGVAVTGSTTVVVAVLAGRVALDALDDGRDRTSIVL